MSYSVVVPAYNAHATIVACLASVAAQTVKPIQVLVIDDCSHDHTDAAVLGCKQSLRDAGIVLEYLRLDVNSGPSVARNVGLDRAEGTYVAFLDADDVWASQKLAVVDRFLGDAAVGLICHSYTEMPFSAVKAMPCEYKAETLSLNRMLLRNPAQTSCAVIRRDVAFTFDERMRYCEDHDLWMRIAEASSVLRLIGSPLTRLGRPQLSAGGLSADTVRMRVGELRVYYNFCRRRWRRRFWLLPGLATFSAAKHVYSWVRRNGPWATTRA